jgi:hypothetical protein
VPCQQISELEQRVSTCEQAAAEHGAQRSMGGAWEQLRAELEASLAQHTHQQDTRVAGLSDELAAQRRSCKAAAQNAGAVAEQAQRSCRAVEKTLAVLASAVEQAQGVAEQALRGVKQQQEEHSEAGPAAQLWQQHSAAVERWRAEWVQQVARVERRLKGLEEAGGGGPVAAQDIKVGSLRLAAQLQHGFARKVPSRGLR